MILCRVGNLKNGKHSEVVEKIGNTEPVSLAFTVGLSALIREIKKM